MITGVLCALAAQIVLGLFGAAFGFAAAPAGEALGVLAAIWGLITPIVASFIGAHIAVRMCGARDDAGVYLHGALVWCIGLILGALFITGSIATGAVSAGAAAGGNIGVRALERHDTAANRTRAQLAGENAGRGAAEGTGAAGVAALLGLGGALLGAGVAKRVLTGPRPMRSRDRMAEEREAATQESGVAYREPDGRLTTRPPATSATGLVDPRIGAPGGDDPTTHH